MRAADANGVIECAEETKPFLAAIAVCSADPIIGEKLDGQITFWNSAAKRLFDFRAEEVLGRSIFTLIPAEATHAQSDLLDRVNRGESVERFETVRVRKDGARLDVSLTISPIRDAAGRVIGASEIVRDITGRKNAERELRRRNDGLNAFLETAQIGLHRVGPDGTVLWANAAEMEMLGYEPEEYIGHHIAEFHADETAINEVLGTLGRGDKLYEYEARLKCKDGSIKHVLIDSSVLWEHGRFVHTQCFTRDITARKESEERFRAVADNIAQFAWMADAQGSIFWYNRRWFEYTGSTLEEMKGWGWMKVHHPDHVERVVRRIQHSWQTGEPWEDTFPLRRKDGVYRWFLSRALPIHDANGKVLRWFGTNTDVTEQRETAMELLRTKNELERLNNDLEKEAERRALRLQETIGELESFSYSIVHDMRAPLRALQGFAQILLDDYGAALDENGKLCLQNLRQSADRMDRMVRDVLNFSNTLRGKLPLESVEVRAVLNGVLESYPQFSWDRVDVVIDGELPAVQANPAALGQCFSNIIANAVKFVAPGLKPRVRISAERDGNTVRMHFDDNGIGIPPEQQEKIFNLFYQLDKSRGGTGVGLAVVRKAVQRMGGRVGVQPGSQGGSCFWIELKGVKA